MEDGLARYVRAARGRAVLLVALVVVSLIVALVGWAVALALGLSTQEYAAGAVPTLVGVVAGIPLALWLIRVGDDVSGQRESEAATTRRWLVLDVIREELQEALDELRGDRSMRPRMFVFPFLKSEAWRALADGGDLRWIDDPELIGRIARAYHRIESTTILERAIFDFENDPPRKTIDYSEGSFRPLEELQRWLSEQDEHTIAAIDDALAGIRTDLAERPPARASDRT